MESIGRSGLTRRVGAALLASALLVANPIPSRAGGADAAGATTAPRLIAPGAPLQTQVRFEPIQGANQAGGSFLARADGYSALIGPASLRIAAAGQAGVRLRYLGADPRARLSAEGRLPGLVSYFLGRDPSGWRAGIPSYARLRVRDLYPGIDLVYYAGTHGLEYDLLVHPGADPSRIRVATTGPITQSRDGALHWSSGGGGLALAAPTIYQPGVRTTVAGGYRLSAGGVLSFRLGRYDRSRMLVLDPFLKVYGTSGFNSVGGSGTAIATDSAGNTYVTGTGSGQFPTTRGAARTQLPNQDVADSAIVVMKLDRTGKMLFSTYLGTVLGNGTTDVSSAGIAVDGAGNVYVTGSTNGRNFPLVHPLITFPADQAGGSLYHAFVTKLSPTGSKVLYSTYLGGDLRAIGTGITVDRAGTAYVVGLTDANQDPGTRQFPVTAHKRPCQAGTDGFIVMINPAGSKMLDAACIGANGSTRLTAVTLDRARSIYVIGYTNLYPPNVPLRLVSSQPGVNNALVVKFDPALQKVIYAAFLGDGSDTRANAIAVDQAGDAFITGSTTGEQFPTTVGAFMRGQAAPTAGVMATFVAKIDPAGKKLRYSTYLSGNTDGAGTGIAVDGHGDAFVAGSLARNLNMAVSADQVTFPLTKGARYTKYNINGDGFLTELNPGGTALRSSTLLGGLVPSGIALGSDGHPALTGSVTLQDAKIQEAKDTWFVVWSL